LEQFLYIRSSRSLVEELETFNQERETIRRTTLAGAKRELHTERNYSPVSRR
jgi:hypothetical protein